MLRLALAGLAILVCASPATAAPSPEITAQDRRAFVAWARDHAVTLPDCTPVPAASGWEQIDAIVGDARLVALGEPVHGAHEPLAFRNCLFRYLVEHRGFAAIAIESGFSESRSLHDFVAGGPGDAPALVRNGLTWGFGRYAENLELIAWMRRYNLDPAHETKISFYGVDLSGGDADGAWRKARLPLDASLDYLARTAPSPSASVREGLRPLLSRFTLADHAAMKPAERARLRAAIRRLIRYFDDHRPALVAASSASDYDWGRQNAVLASQAETYFQVSRAPGGGEDLAPEDYRADAARDLAMADNVRWVVDREGATGRVMVFAHDGHVMNAPTRGGIWSVYSRPPRAMGQHLRAALGPSMLILPIISSADDPRGGGHGHPGSLDGALAETGLDRFAIDRRRSSPAWLDRPWSMRVNFATEAVFEPSRALDALIFLRNLSPASMKTPTPRAAEVDQ